MICLPIDPQPELHILLCICSPPGFEPVMGNHSRLHPVPELKSHPSVPVHVKA